MSLEEFPEYMETAENEKKSNKGQQAHEESNQAIVYNCKATLSYMRRVL
jgi:hypothetical protein